MPVEVVLGLEQVGPGHWGEGEWGQDSLKPRAIDLYISIEHTCSAYITPYYLHNQTLSITNPFFFFFFFFHLIIYSSLMSI